jgi:hypothetical protein
MQKGGDFSWWMPAGIEEDYNNSVDFHAMKYCFLSHFGLTVYTLMCF